MGEEAQVQHSSPGCSSATASGTTESAAQPQGRGLRPRGGRPGRRGPSPTTLYNACWAGPCPAPTGRAAKLCTGPQRPLRSRTPTQPHVSENERRTRTDTVRAFAGLLFTISAPLARPHTPGPCSSEQQGTLTGAAVTCHHVTSGMTHGHACLHTCLLPTSPTPTRPPHGGRRARPDGGAYAAEGCLMRSEICFDSWCELRTIMLCRVAGCCGMLTLTAPTRSTAALLVFRPRWAL